MIVGIKNQSILPTINSLVVIKPDIYINEENKNEYCLKAYIMVEGVESEHNLDKVVNHILFEQHGF